MSKKYHIDGRGEVKVCKAYKRQCRYGQHFTSENEAKKFAELELKAEFELLPTVLNNGGSFNQKLSRIERVGKLLSQMEKRSNKKEFAKRKELADMALKLREEIPESTWYSRKAEKGSADGYKVGSRIRSFRRNKEAYFNRMRWANRVDSFDVESEETYHYNTERKDKREQMNEIFEEGKVIGYYKVKHTLDKKNFLKGKQVDYCTQVVEVRDNGRCIIHDTNGNIVTTFLANHSRIEAWMTKAYEVPNQNFLDTIKINKTIAVLLEIEK